MNNTADNQDTSNKLLDNQKDEKMPPSQTSTPKPSLLFSKRFFITILLFFSNISMILIEHNININIIEMTSPKQIKNGDLNETQPPEFPWDPARRGVVLSVSAYGRLLSFLSGPLISKLGGATTWGLSMMAAGITTLLQPISLRYDFFAFLACRFLIGAFDSFYNASALEACSRWIPKCERGTLISVSVNGVYVGIAIAYPICGLIISELGWAAVFYLLGGICVIMSLLCLILIRNQPSEDKWISKKELAYILKETDTVCPKKDITRPYRTILSSPPIWALCTGYFVNGWVVMMLLAGLPLLIKDLTNKETKEVAIISSIPSILGIFISLAAGTIMDYWKNNSSISLTRMHKILIGVSYASQMFLFVALTFVSNLTTIMILFVLIRAFLPFGFLILRLISVSITPNHTGITASIVMSFFSLSKIANQMVVGFLTYDHTAEEWNQCFILTAGLLICGAIAFVLYGSSEAQSWSLASNLQKQPQTSDESELEFIKK
ncbi:vesicular glutamate transporter 3-like [Planococcus citri]|uniref:vesicular glutamate transporter 3-like n=1 Tax=Planococcus citri TaxID=170843 RepID=UPI0031F82BC2